MDLTKRKYRLIQELIGVEDESLIKNLEQVLRGGKEINPKISASNEKELDRRLESYKRNPQNLLDWEDVKNDW